MPCCLAKALRTGSGCTCGPARKRWARLARLVGYRGERPTYDYDLEREVIALDYALSIGGRSEASTPAAGRGRTA